MSSPVEIRSQIQAGIYGSAGYPHVATLSNQYVPKFYFVNEAGLIARIDSRRLLSVRDSAFRCSQLNSETASKTVFSTRPAVSLFGNTP